MESYLQKKKNHENYKIPISLKKFSVDNHIGVAAAGYIPDARPQVDNARFFSQSNRMIYDEPIEVEAVAKHLADQAQQYTQYAGVRPFGVALIIAGIDKSGSTIYLTDPSGTYISYDAVAIGAGADQVTRISRKELQEDMTVEEAAAMAIESIYLVSEEKEGVKHIKMAQIPTATKMLTRTSEKDIEHFASKAKEISPRDPSSTSCFITQQSKSIH